MISFTFVLLVVVPIAMIGLVMILNEASENKGKK
jgi:preprotein translocase subunit SecG